MNAPMLPKLNSSCGRTLAIRVGQFLMLAGLLFAISGAPAAGAPISLGEALDAPALVWTTGGNASWSGQSDTTHDGADAARSGVIFDGQESWIQTTVNGPGTVAFSWKASSEGDYDFLEFTVGGIWRAEISGEQTWQRVAIVVGDGAQTLRWKYYKDSGSALGLDAVWVDEVTFASQSGPPVILLQPANQLVVTGLTATLQVSAQGASPLRYQWYLGSDAIAGATSPTLQLANVSPTNSGSYSVIVTNLNGITRSSNALLTVTPLRPVEDILLFLDHGRTSPYESALTNQNRVYRRFTLASELSFTLAVEGADPGRTLVLFDTAEWGHSLNAVERFVRAGGRALLQYPLLGLNSHSTTPSAFEVSVIESLTFPSPLYDWGGSTFFAGVPSPLGFSDLHNIDGQRLQPVGGARAVAGIIATPFLNQAGLVIGNSNRTIVNGFILSTASSAISGVRLAQNEIEFLAGPPVPRPPIISSQPANLMVVTGATAMFRFGASGTAPLHYQWYFNQTNEISNATNATLLVSNAQAAHVGTYHAILTNNVGAVTSRLAALTLTTNGRIQSVLRLSDYLDTVYNAALSNAALSNLQVSSQSFSIDALFIAAVQIANPGTTLVIVDAVNNLHDFSAVERFARAGGRVIFEYLQMEAGSLSAAFQLSTVNPFDLTSPVYPWNGSPFFDAVSTPLTLRDTFIISGQRLQPAPGGQAVAGFTSSPSAGEAAIVIGNTGHTIVNGFALEDILPSSAAIQLAQNELLYLFSQGVPAPFILFEPADRIAVQGGTVSFTIGAGGSPPLRYQWFRSEGDTVPNATNATMTLSNLQLSFNGGYYVVVSNASGSVTSRIAQLTVTTLRPVERVLLFNDYIGINYETALSSLGIPYEPYPTDTTFGAAVRSANLSTTLVVVDAAAVPNHDFSAVESFVRSGGRALMQYLDMPAGSLSAAFGISTLQTFQTASPVFKWNNSTLFDGVGSPLLVVDQFFWDGQRCQPAPGAEGMAGFVNSPTAGQAAIIIGNSGRTIVNAFALEEVAESRAATRLAQNEIVHLLSQGVPGPSIMTHPKSATVVQGASVSLFVVAVGTPPLRFQWYHASSALPNATNATLALSPVQPSDAGAYYVVVSNTTGVATSHVAQLTVTSLGPIATVLLYKDYFPDRYEVALNALGLPYQIYTDIGEFNATVNVVDPATTLVVVDAVAAPGRDFSAVESFVRSGGRALLQYLDLQAGSLSAAFGLDAVQPFEFTPPIYPWGASALFEGVTVPLGWSDLFIRSGQRYQPATGAEAAAGFVSSPTPGEAAIVIGNSGRTIVNGFALEEMSNFSNAVRLAQNELQFLSIRTLTIVSQPTNQAARVGGSITNFVRALSPSGPVRYQWQFGGTNLPGATNVSLVLTGFQSQNAGTYSVVVTDRQASVTIEFTLELLVPPVFVQQPISQSAVVGGTITFSAQFTGRPPPFTSEWRRLTAPLKTNFFVSSDTQAFFTLSGLQTNDFANYRLVVKSASNPSPGLGSAIFTLTVLDDVDRDLLPDAWEIANGLNVGFNDAGFDADDDGVSNIDEYNAGTDPRDSSSYLKIDTIAAFGVTTLSFHASSNKTYTVLRAESLDGGNWTKLIDITARPSDRIETITDPRGGPKGYYRLVTPRQP